MTKIVKVGLFGDSILKGVQVHSESKQYYVNKYIDEELLNKKYSMEVKNYSTIGCTVTRGKMFLQKRLESNLDCDAIVMDYGGNDCDYNWKEIAENPEGNHFPKTPIALFIETYTGIIDTLRKKGISPVLTTLPPLEPQKFFDWFCKDLNKINVLKWLGDINRIYEHQNSYSKVIEKIAADKEVPLIDLRQSFLKFGNTKALLCEDGTHPNTLGQRIIGSCFYEFIKSRQLVTALS